MSLFLVLVSDKKVCTHFQPFTVTQTTNICYARLPRALHNLVTNAKNFTAKRSPECHSSEPVTNGTGNRNIMRQKPKKQCRIKINHVADVSNATGLRGASGSREIFLARQ